MKRNLLVTLSDDSRLEQAMHLFSCVYFNSGWKGDYMLMAYNVPDSKLDRFRKKGILVKKVKSFVETDKDRNMRIYSCKLNLFAEDMKKWDKIIFLDNDTIVRASLDKLLNAEYFSASSEIDEQNIFYQFNLEEKNDSSKYNFFINRYCKGMDLDKPAFNVGVIAFDPKNVITNVTLNRMKSMIKEAVQLSSFVEQAVLNIYFYNKWRRLPKSYNLQPWVYMTKYKIKLKNLRAIIFHFAGYRPETRPWVKNNLFYDEWQEMYLKFEQIDLNHRLPPASHWNTFDIFLNDTYLAFHRIKFNIFG